MDATQEPQALARIEAPQLEEQPTTTGEPTETEHELTFKQQKWLDIYVKTGNATEAAMQAYDCKDRHSAKAIGSENLSKLDFIDFLELAGVSDKLLTDKLKEGLNSTRYHQQKNGKFLTTPDYQTRHRYVETGFKLKRRLVERQEIEETNTVNINVNALLVKVYGGTTTEPASTT